MDKTNAGQRLDLNLERGLVSRRISFASELYLLSAFLLH
jgi:hypothetical protein